MLTTHVHASESYGLAILRGLQRKPVWQGDATPHRTARRRAASRVACVSRRTNRSR